MLYSPAFFTGDWPIVSTFSRHALVVPRSIVPSSQTYPVASLALYYPFRISTAMVARIMFWANGATVAGNIDVGIYAEDGTRLVSTGQTAQSGTQAIQSVSIAATPLGAGIFYLGIAGTNASTCTLRAQVINSVMGQCCGFAQQSSISTLPVTATFATMAQSFMPWFGFSTRGFV